MKKLLAVAAVIRAARNFLNCWYEAPDKGYCTDYVTVLRDRLEEYNLAISRGDSTDA